jgi:hypothetical protein
VWRHAGGKGAGAGLRVEPLAAFPKEKEAKVERKRAKKRNRVDFNIFKQK